MIDNIKEMMDEAKREEHALIFVLNNGLETEISFDAKSKYHIVGKEREILVIEEHWKFEAEDGKPSEEGFGKYLFRVSAIDLVHIA